MATAAHTGSKQDQKTYAAREVIEVWRYCRDTFSVLVLTDGEYIETAVSRIASGLPVREVARRIVVGYQTKEQTTLALCSEWQQWLRENRHLHIGL